jgi:hypothetical protein
MMQPYKERWVIYAATVLSIAVSCLAQAGKIADDPNANLPGVRFTPGMARSLGALYGREVLKNRYEIPDDKLPDAQEKVARRLMELAHKVDGPGQEILERFFAEQMDYQSTNPGQHAFMPPGYGKEFADKIMPMLPEVRRLAKNVSQDIRPMLGMKQQLKMAGDLMAFNTATDAFEKTMQQWSSGQTKDFGDPFNKQPDKQEIKKDKDGISEELKQIRQYTQRAKPRADQWKHYLNQFKKLYQLDAAQSATADSILREYTDREKALATDEGSIDRLYRAELWLQMIYRLREGWMNPARSLLEDEIAACKAPVDQLETEFKTRLESIPTRDQRRAMEKKINDLLKEKHLVASETQP